MNFTAQSGALNGISRSVSLTCNRQDIPIVRLSDTTGAISSPNSSRASRPILNSAPVIGARTLSPEQSAKIFAVTVWNFCVVVCQPVTDFTRFLSISQARQEQLSIRSMFGSFLISSYVTLSQIEKLSVGFASEVHQRQFLDDAALVVVPSVRAAYPHPYLSGGVSA